MSVSGVQQSQDAQKMKVSKENILQTLEKIRNYENKATLIMSAISKLDNDLKAITTY